MAERRREKEKIRDRDLHDYRDRDRDLHDYRDRDRDRDRDHRERDRDRDRDRGHRKRSRSPEDYRHRKSRSRSADDRHHYRRHRRSPSSSPSHRRKRRREGSSGDVEDHRDGREKKKQQPSVVGGDGPPAAAEGIDGGVGPTDADPDEVELMKKLGIPVGFDSTKGKPVLGADVSGVRVGTKRQPRQYMNRRGGFNRPLPPERNR